MPHDAQSEPTTGTGRNGTSMTGGDALAEVLRREGVEQVFYFPASPIAEPLARAGIRLILTRQERVAGNMADGVSRSTNGHRIGVFAVQESAGAENAFAGVAHAHTDSTPTLFLPGHPGLYRAFEHPTFEALDHFRSVTKYAATALSPEAIPYRLRQAFSALRTGRPGPALVELPEAVTQAPFEGDLVYEPVPRVRSAADFGAVREAADRLLRASTPFIWAGNGVLYAEATAELIEVAELLGAPVMTTLQGKSAFPENHPLSAGVAGNAKTPMATHFLAACDVLLAVGSSLSHSNFTPMVPPGKAIIHATNDPSDLNKAYPCAVPIAADARLFLRQLADELKARVGATERERRAATAATLGAIRSTWLAEYEPLFSDDRSPINAYRMFRELWACLDPDTTMLTHESGASRDIQSVFYPATSPRSYLGWGHSSQLGFSIGLAMGARLANPDRLVVNVMGDGAVGMTGMDLETAVREDIPILTVVKHDSLFSGYSKFMPLAIERFHATHQTGDYAALATALGSHAERVTQVAQLRPAFERAINAVRGGQPALVDVITAETTRLST